MVNTIDIFAIEDGDCIHINGAEYFHYSPGGYDPGSHVMSDVECRAKCGSFFLPYSGILKQKLCLCAKDDKVEKVPIAPIDECGTNPDLLVFYRSNIIISVTGLTVKPSDDVVQTATDVVFSMSYDTGEDVEFTIDYGDGSSGTFNDVHDVLAHKYYVPGKYKVQVSAKPVGAPESYRVLASTEVTVADSIEDKSVVFSCPPVVKPTVVVTCNLTTITGGFVTMEIDYGDESDKVVMGLPDTNIQALGPLIPQHLTPEMAPKESGYMLVIPQHEPVNTRGRLSAVQLWALESGAMAVMVLRKKCPEGTVCPVIRDIRTCSKEDSFCAQLMTCTSNKIIKCPHHRLNKVLEFEIVHVIQITVEIGHQYVTLTDTPEVLPGDIIGFISTMAKVSYRKPYPKEEPDLGAVTFDMQETVIPQEIITNTQKVHYLQAIVNNPIELGVQYLFNKKTGMHDVVMKLSNKFSTSPVIRKQEVDSQRPLAGLKLSVNPPDVSTTEQVTIEIKISGGTFVDVIWEFGDGRSKKEFLREVKKGGKYEKTYKYPEPGVYVIRVKASNPHANFTQVHILKAQRPVLPIYGVTTNTPQILPSAIMFELTYPGSELLPTNATAVFTFGDKKTWKWNVPKEGEGIQESFEHKYRKPGVYLVNIRISNIVSSYTLLTEVETAVRIRDLAVNVLYSPMLGSHDQIAGYGPEKNKFPVERNVTFHMSVATGEVELYIVQMANGTTLMNSSDTTYTTMFQEPGFYNFTVSAYNHVQKTTDPVFLFLYLMEPVEGLIAIDNVNATLEEEEDKEFEIYLERVGTDTCLLVDYDDGTVLRAFGNGETCNDTAEEVVWEGELENPLVIRHSYISKGYIDAFFKAFNAISEVNTTVRFFITNQTCKAPDLAIRNRIPSYYLAPETFRSLPVVLYSYTTMKCNDSADTVRSWSGFKLNETNGQVIEEIDLTMVDSYRKSMLYLRPFFLKGGIYKFKFTVNMTVYIQNPPLILVRSVETFVKVVPSPVIVRLTEGAQSRVTRGWGQSLILDPGQNSIDPDDENNKNFTIKWFCRRLPGEVINRNLTEDMQNISDPIYDRSVLYRERPTGLPTPSSEESSEEDDENKDSMLEEPDLGGCFGKGPGMINVTESYVNWNTTVFRRSNVTYEMILKLEMSDRDPSWGGLQIVLLEHIPPIISVECQTEKLCYPNDPIGQRINPVRVGLIGLCKEGCDTELLYEWQVFGVDAEGNETYLAEAGEFLVGATEKKMALSEDFFKEYYPTYGDFIAKLIAENEYGLRGESDLFLHINQPPEGGNCTIVPENGRSLIDIFSVSCLGWADPEGKEIEYFAYWTIHNDTGALIYLSAGPDPEATLVLPYGLFELGVDIKDKEGALARINITTMMLEPPFKQDYDNFMNNRQLEQVEASGDQARMNQVSQALSSLMNVRMPLDENSTFEETTTTDPGLLDKEAEQKAQTRLKMVRSVSSVMNTDTLGHLEQIGSALTAIAGDGTGIDNEGMEAIIFLLNKTVALANNMQVEAPQQLLDFCMYAVGTMGGIVARMTEQLISGVVLPTDRTKALDFEYDVEIPLYGEEEKDSFFDGTIPLEEALTKAVIKHEREQAEGHIRTIVDLTIRLVLAMLKNIIVGEKPMEFIAPSGLGLTISMFKGGTLSNRAIQHGDAVYVFPDVCDILSEIGCWGNETLGVMAVSWPAILDSYGDSVDLLSNDTKTLQLIMLDENLDMMLVQNTTGWFTIKVPRGSKKEGAEPALPEPSFAHAVIKWNEEMVYHQFIVEKADSAVNIEITPTDPDVELLIFVKHRVKPLLHSYDLMINLAHVREENGTYDLFLNNEVIQNRTGFFYLGIIESNSTAQNNSIPDDMMFDSQLNFTHGEAVRDFSTNYSVRIYTSGCYFYNYDLRIWSGSGCYVENATAALTQCKCNHLTSFGGGFFVAPNTVDFSYVFANAGFADNVTIYMTIINIMLIYLALLIWARRQDIKDREKLGATPLHDNDAEDKYLYEMIVFTGNKDAAATDSKVQFILSGDDDETVVRTLEDPKRKLFRRNAADTFVMATPRPLGRLNYLRIWHDNSGKGKFKSWLLNFVIIRDVQTGARYEFVCNRWLAVEKEDGLIDRLLPVAGKGEATEFNHLFHQKTQKNLSDGHLWFSIFMRPPKSRFTRAQRVTSCFAMLFLSMLVNAMWYGRVPSKPSGSAFSLGPLSLSPEQIGVGVMANFIVFPPTFLMITLFRKSKLRNLRPSHITEAIKKQKASKKKLSTISRPSSAHSGTTLILDDISQEDESRRENRFGAQKKKKKKFLFPWWCRIIAWILAVSSIVVSCFFLWAYGVQFGDEKTKKWITSLLISFFSSILVTQPIKVFLVAMFFSAIFKTVDTEEEEDEDEEPPELAPDEEWLHKEAETKEDKRKLLYKPADMAKMERAKLERIKELQMTAILREICSYAFLFGFLLYLVMISGTADFYKWTRNILVPELIVGKWYNGDQPFGLRGFLNDRVNRIMGYGILRQVRIKERSCNVDKRVKSLTEVCRGHSNILFEDKKSYEPGWKVEAQNDTNDEYRYRTSKELNGLPFWAIRDVYGGGGYVFPLRGTHEKLKEEIFHLEKSDWIDEKTRAVFAEFSVYNAQVNLFGVMTIVAEFLPGGGVVPFYRLEVIRLMRYHQGFGAFVLACELGYVIFTLYFLHREYKKFRLEGRDYFKSYWNWAEVMVISLSISAIVFYSYRMMITRKILSTFEKTHGNGYIKMQYVASVDEVFGFLMAFLMFIAILKFIKLFFYLVFGITLREFSSFVTAAETTFSIMNGGGFDFDAICLASPLLGPLSFFVFCLITTIVLLNIFVTLILSSFQDVKEDIGKQANDYEIVDFMWKKLKGFFFIFDDDKPKNDDDFDNDVKPIFKLSSNDDKIQDFPEKVDRLLNHINSFYFDGQLDLNSKKALKSLYKKDEDNDFDFGMRKGNTKSDKMSFMSWNNR
ncbi:polycystic kidney disease protein 1-like 2 [Caerostris darwini]|uniref:Polycystic kidney disease protein 1-like 2 n=1 Tax=Caerostris darwini TaxID=1538125 RepID=A0AAV4SAH5_9ARAC|nr:polycystic kidney disease protein 1-like 2 [Caerostris darwini]